MHKNFLSRLVCKINNNSIEKNGIFTYVNPHSYLQLRGMNNLIDGFSKIYCDGLSFVIFLRLIGVQAERKSFDSTSMAIDVLKWAELRGMSVYFVGGEIGVVDRAVEYFLNVVPDLAIVGKRNGFFLEDEYLDFLNDLKKINPDLIIVGMGSPKQEKFLIDLKSIGWNGVGYTCGGYFHQTASAGINYYPEKINKYNLRWLYRLFNEPNLLKRYTLTYAKFAIIFAIDLVNFKLKR